MWQNILRFITFIIFLSLVALFQISTPFVWLGFFSEFNFIPLILVSLLFFYNSKTALLAALIIGFWLDIFSFSFFGLEIISLFVVLILIDRISFSWLTNRSFYSFLLINLLFVIFYSLISSLLFYFSYLDYSTFFIVKASFWLSLFYRLIWTLIIAIVFFHPFTTLTKNFSPVFLEKK